MNSVLRRKPLVLVESSEFSPQMEDDLNIDAISEELSSEPIASQSNQVEAMGAAQSALECGIPADEQGRSSRSEMQDSTFDDLQQEVRELKGERFAALLANASLKKQLIEAKSELLAQANLQVFVSKVLFGSVSRNSDFRWRATSLCRGRATMRWSGVSRQSTPCSRRPNWSE
jgi:hypothetical protein